jgi:hypothetical protein
VSPMGSCVPPHGTAPHDDPDPSTHRQANTVASIRQQYTDQRQPGSLLTKRPATSRFAPTMDWREQPVHPGCQTRRLPPNHVTRRNRCGLAANVYHGTAALRPLMVVRESITTVWGATMGRWHGSTIIRSRHCVGGGLYEGHIEMYIGMRHPLAQNYCLKNRGPVLGTAPPPISE